MLLRRLGCTLLFLCLCYLAVAPSAAAQEEKRYELSNFDVTVQVRPDGAYAVEETLTYDFQQGPFTYAYRSIDADNVDAIRDIRVASPDVPVDSVRRTEADDNVRVRWTYPERQAPATFTIRYVVEGALLERGDRNEVVRDVLDPGATVPTRDVDVRVVLSQAFDLTADSVTADPAADARLEDTAGGLVATFHRDRVAEGDGYEVAVSFPKRLAGRYAPTAGDVVFGLFLVLLGVGLGGWANWRWRGPRVESNAMRPPDDVTLPSAAALLGRGADGATSAVLFDLAKRGHLTLQHDQERTWAGTKDLVRLNLHPTPSDLSDMEAALVEQLRPHDTVEDVWSDTRSFRQEQFQAVQDDLVAAGWLERHRTRSNVLIGVSVAGAVVGFGVALMGLGAWSVFGFCGGLGLGIGGLVAAARRTVLTEEGARRTAALRSFLDHEKAKVERLLDTSPARAAERGVDMLPWLIYHPDVTASWLEEMKTTLADAEEAPTLPDGFASLVEPTGDAAPVAAFLPIVGVVGTMESTGAGAAAAGGGAAGGAAGGGAAGAG
jgi:hypothetical protein